MNPNEADLHEGAVDGSSPSYLAASAPGRPRTAPPSWPGTRGTPPS